MTNRQWLMNEMQNMSDEEFVNKISIYDYVCAKQHICRDINCGSTKCVEKQINWLKSEHKEIPKISDAERVILENVKGFKWICRDKSGYLYLYSAKPFKNGTIYRGWNTDQRIDENF